MSEDNAQPTTYDNNTTGVAMTTPAGSLSVTTTTTTTKNNNNNNTASSDNKKKGGGKAATDGGDGKKRPTKAQIEQSIRRKTWVDRIVTVILVAALIVYFIVLIISMVSSGNSTLVETEEKISQLDVPYHFIELYSDSDDGSIQPSCTLKLYVSDTLQVDGKYNTDKTFTVTSSADGWEIVNLAEYASDSEDGEYRGIIVIPPSDMTVEIDRNIANYLEFKCDDTTSTTVYFLLYYKGQYDQYESGTEEVEALSYDSYEVKLAYDTNFDLTWSSIEDQLQFATPPEELDGIDGIYNYYDMDLSGVYALSGITDSGTATYAGYRKKTKYVYQDSTTFYDVVAAIGGMYTSLASIIAWFTIKFLWGYEFKIFTWKVYNWIGYAPYAPKTAKKEGEEEGGEEDAGDDGIDM